VLHVIKPSSAAKSRKVLRDVAPPFLRLGLTAFGGPAAHIAMMEEEFVRRRGWIRHDEFLDMLGASNLVPGPSSTEMAIHIGHRRAGWEGLVVAGVSFILPAMLLVLACAWAYAKFGSLPQLRGILYGVKPVIIAVILNALWRLARAAAKDAFLVIVGIVGTAAALAGGNVLVILIAAGIVATLRQSLKQRAVAVLVPPLLAAKASLPASAPAAVTLAGIFVLFLKFGAVVFGSGYVLLAFLQADLVNRLHWMTQSQLLDAIAVGQVTPGPVFTTATFIGYLVGGMPGAILATVAIFLPGFVYVALSRPLIPRIRGSALAGAFLDGVNAGAVALMIAVTFQLGSAALVDTKTALMATLSAIALVYFRVNSIWPILAGALIGLVVSGHPGGWVSAS
jgi:chromate transporter